MIEMITHIALHSHQPCNWNENFTQHVFNREIFSPDEATEPLQQPIDKSNKRYDGNKIGSYVGNKSNSRASTLEFKSRMRWICELYSAWKINFLLQTQPS